MMSYLMGDPFVETGVLAVVGAIVTRILLRRYHSWRLAFQLVFFIALTALLHNYDIVPYEVTGSGPSVYEQIFIAMAKIIWWINAAWLLTGAARVFLIFEYRPREGRLLQDVVVGIIYLGAALSVVAYVFNAPIGTLIATSGVFAVVLGLALQSTLADVFSGIALNFSKPYEVGDWIVLSDGTEGRVVETNWRATHLLNASNDLVMLPNSVLGKTQLTNLSSPNRSHGVKVRIRFEPTLAPSAVVEIMRVVLLSSTSIMSTPVPTIEIKSLDAQAIEFELSFRVRDFSAAATAKHEIYDLIFRHARAAGLKMAQPKEALAVTVTAPAPDAAPAGRSTELRLLDAVPLFLSLSEEEKQALAQTMVRRIYRKGDVLVEQGAKLTSLMVVRNGVVTVSRLDETGETEVARLSPGDYFGESGLFTGNGELGTVRAVTAATIYEVGQAGLAKLMHERPSMADEISVDLLRQAKAGSTGKDDQSNAAAGLSVSLLVNRIRQIFELAND